MTSNKKRIVFSILYVIFLFALTYLLFPINFDSNDDSSIMYTVAGYRTGIPEEGTIFTNVLWGYLLSFLYKLIPVIPWYPFAFIALLICSCFCILNAILRVAELSKFPFFLAIVLYTCLHFSSIYYYSVFLQFTFLSGICGTAAIATFITKEKNNENKIINIDFIVFIVLMTFSLIIRPKSGYVQLAFFFLFFVKEIIHVLKNKESGKILVAYALITFLLVCATLAIQTAYENTHDGWKEFREYHVQRQEYTDYASLSFDEAPETYSNIGWSAELQELVSRWYFMDERISKETFTVINESKGMQTFTHNSNNSLEKMLTTMKASLFDNYKLSIVVAMLIVLAFLGSLNFFFCRSYLDSIWILGIVASFFVVSIIFSFWGRYPQRMAYSMVSTSFSLVIIQFIRSCKNRNLKKLSFIGSLFLIILASTLSFGLSVKETIFRAENMKFQNDLRLSTEAYCADRSENIYIYGVSMAAQGDPFVVYTTEKPLNYFFYGGSTMYSPLYYKQLEANNLSPLTSQKFADESVYFISNKYDETITILYTMLQEDYGCSGYKLVDTIEEDVLVHQFFFD